MKIFSIVGARPQFIKLAPLSEALSAVHEELILHTGQHYDFLMSDQIFEDLDLRKPDIQLTVSPGSPTVQTAEMTSKIDEALQQHQPNLVIVFGDTNSTLAAVLATAKRTIPLIHIEAGLRSFNKKMPEEINRIVADRLSDYLFAPTQTAVKNLQLEGLAAQTFFTGDIMVDTLNRNLPIALRKSTIKNDLSLNNNEFNLLTLHRNYTVDNLSLLQQLLDQLNGLNEKILFPVHPRTRNMMDSTFRIPENIQITNPIGYLDFILLESASKRIITDSGGIQKEAYLLKKPCITLRPETEWVETVSSGWNCLINPKEKSIVEKIKHFKVPEFQPEIFGNQVTQKMMAIINNISK